MRRNINDSQAFRVQVWAGMDILISEVIMVHPIPHQSPRAALQQEVEKKLLPQLVIDFGEGVELKQSYNNTNGSVRFDINVDKVAK